MNLRLFIGALLLIGAGSASSQPTVYRCGNEYTRTPCSQGRVVETQNSATTEARRAEAARVVASERRLAEDMARDRRLAEASSKPASAGSLSAPKVAAAEPREKAKSRKKVRGKALLDERDDFVASAPKPKKK